MKARWDSVRDVIVSSRADIVCLQETKVMAVNHFFLGSVFGSNFDKFVLLPADGTRGLVGVLLLLGRVQQFRS